MRRGLKLALAGGLFAGGLGGAWAFRRPPAEVTPDVGGEPPPRAAASLERGGATGQPLAASHAGPPSAARLLGTIADSANPTPQPDEEPQPAESQVAPDSGTDGIQAESPSPGELAAGAGEQPRLSDVFPPDQPVPPELQPETPAGRASKAPLAAAVAWHKVRDGDTLSALAERYLGTASRFQEIFDANQDLLKSPDLLPIGANLRIPADLPPVDTDRLGADSAATNHPPAPPTESEEPLETLTR